MAVQEILLVSIDGLNEDGATQRINQVLLVRVALEASGHMAWEREAGNNNHQVKRGCRVSA